MKKILASCLTCCALLGSMCFSSPLAQLHATSTEAKQSEIKPIDLNVSEETNEVIGYTHTIKASVRPGTQINISNEGTPCGLSDYDVNVNNMSKDNGVFRTGSSEDSFKLSFRLDDKIYIIKGEVEAEGHLVEMVNIDISKTETYNDGTIEVEPINKLKIDETKANLPVGSKFSLKLPKKVKTFLDDYYGDIIVYDTYLRHLTVNGENISSGDCKNYINKIDDENIQIDDTYWQYHLKSEVKAGDKITFNAYTYLRAMSSIDDNTVLVNYNSESEITYPELEITYPRVIDPTNPGEIDFPVELTIVEDGKGDPIDDEELALFLNLTPEYKKLTEKGETYKVDANVEIDENESLDNKEIFESLKADGAFDVSFVSRDTGVATVSEDGTVTAVANGSTEILAYVKGYENELFGISKVDVEIPEEEAVVEEESSYPKTGDNFMAVSAAILTLGLSALVVAFMSRKPKDVNEEK